MSYDFAFPELYERWRGHDLNRDRYPGAARPWFYENLKSENEYGVWKFIEDEYLLRYESFLAIRFDWHSSGLWSIPFPGSMSNDYNIGGLEESGLTQGARDLLEAWHDPLDARPLVPDEEDDFDYEASDLRGLSAAKEVRRDLEDNVYLEFRHFQEISIVDGRTVELEVPERILELSGSEPR